VQVQTGLRDVRFDGATQRTPIYWRDHLPLEAQIIGPAVIEQTDTHGQLRDGSQTIPPPRDLGRVRRGRERSDRVAGWCALFTPEHLGKEQNIPLAPGDRVQTPGGGGYGDPMTRDPDLTAEDARLGRYTAEQTQALLDVTVDGTCVPDIDATRHSRTKCLR
jgi:N-methylhydantoinase B/oxoprolinase/acetone carboxylase alpha subunit